MNNKLFGILMFTAGAAVGAALTWKVVETKYNRIVREEIDSVKEMYIRREKEKTEDDSDDADDNSRAIRKEEIEARRKEKAEALAEYEKTLDDEGYWEKRKNQKGDKEMREPFVISPEVFEDNEHNYEVFSLTYYNDEVLTDSYDEVIDAVDYAAIIGLDALDSFGEYEDDSVFVQNDSIRVLYEILKDNRNYSDVVGSTNEE